jgi:arabinosyltransferase A/arabinosyltransferase B/arabinosyltransferase C
MPAQVVGIPVATLLLVAGAVVVAVALVRGHRRVRGAVPLLAVVLVCALALQVLGLARVAVAHRDSYTLTSDAVATLRGDPCGLQRTLSVETDPAAGLLTAASTADSRGTVPPGPAANQPSTGIVPPGPTGDRPITGAVADRPITASPGTTGDDRPTTGTVPPGAVAVQPTTAVPVDIGGTTLPGFVVDRPVTTDWFPLRGDLVVVTTVGTLRPGDDVRLDFGGETRRITESGDTRMIAPARATAVRLVIDAGTGGTARVTLPRAPRLTPMEQVLPPGTRAILDWPVAFLFPCLVPEPLPPGVPTWRVAPPTSDPAAGITYAPGFGGPFAGPRLLVTQQRLPTYLAGDPTRDAVRLYRWIPIMPLTTPQPVVTEHTVMGWTSDGHARVPGLDPVG